MANCQEEPINRQIIHAFVSFALAIHHVSPFYATVAVQAERVRLEEHFDFLVVQHAILHRFRSAQVRFTHNHVNLRCQTGQIRGFLARRVSTAHNSHNFLPIEKTIARGASRNTGTLIFRFVGQSEVFRGSSGRNDQRIRQDFALVIKFQREGTFREVGFYTHLVANLRSEALCLLAKILHQLISFHSLGITGEVFDFCCLRKLSSRLQSFVDHR